MNRPHVRFDGRTLRDIDESWPHAQNDALGYFLWLYCMVNSAERSSVSQDDWRLLRLFPLYLRSIRYWEDADSGHWEEAPKVGASSIGAVVAGLDAMLVSAALQEHLLADAEVTRDVIADLIRRGREQLAAILPAESLESGHQRPYDGALLFLIYPLRAIEPALPGTKAAEILANVELHLKGSHGVRRYPGDSFWCRDYDRLIDEDRRTADFSGSLAERDALLRPGEEAQWCIFDPILSIIYGEAFEASGEVEFYKRQVHYVHRSLGQLTAGPSGELWCPELYYLRSVMGAPPPWPAEYHPNPMTPLLWTQANLMLALQCLKRTSATLEFLV